MPPKKNATATIDTISPSRAAMTGDIGVADEDTTPSFLRALREPGPTPPRTKRNIAEITESDRTQQWNLQGTKREIIGRRDVVPEQKGKAQNHASRTPWLATRLRPRLALGVLRRTQMKHAEASNSARSPKPSKRKRKAVDTVRRGKKLNGLEISKLAIPASIKDIRCSSVADLKVGREDEDCLHEKV